MSEIPTRLIGPIPPSYCACTEGEDGNFNHPGGPAPRWGGYSPLAVKVPLSWLSPEIQSFVTQSGICWDPEGRPIRGVIYMAHTADTLLVLAANGWYVAAPKRLCRRGVVIAVDALRDGVEMPGGLLPEEAAEAMHIHREGGAAYCARLSWEKEPTYPTAEPVDGEVELFRRSGDE